MSPFALVAEIRQVFDGCLVLAGAINTGGQIAAARLMGADLAYLGTRFIATAEAMASDDYQRMILSARMADVLYTPKVSGIAANFLRPSLVAAGLDPDALPSQESLDLSSETRAWSRIWSAGQGVGGICDLPGA